NFLDCASIFEFSQGVRVVIYPNPSRGIFDIRAENLTDDLVIDVADLSGKSILKQRIPAAQNNGARKIDLTGQEKKCVNQWSYKHGSRRCF
ncbi:MAG: T9SS type A sorting domain-containing protein, partial [Spirochaetes bacterium]|nr:T9SS type A sorting domain-containing protein [Spirochaetota bacterium]